MEYGLDTKFESLLRQLIELIVNIVYVLRDKNNYKRLLLKEYKEQISFLNYIDKNDMYSFILKEKIDCKKIEFEKYIKELKDSGVKECPSFKNLCEDLKMHELYACYRFLCGYTHEGFGAVYQHTIKKEDVFLIDVNPKWEDINNQAYRLINLIEIIVLNIIKKFNLNLVKEYKEIQTRYKRLIKLSYNGHD